MVHQTIWKRLTAYLKATTPLRQSCFWSVDVHSHLIPGIDDGVPDSEQALICLSTLSEWGIRKLVTTPHVNGDWYRQSDQAILTGEQTLQSLIEQHQLPLQVVAAAEYLVDDHFYDLLQQKKLLTFGKERYVLIETGWHLLPNQFAGLLERIYNQGYKPVLAHPERYRYFHNNRTTLHQLHEMGCLLQLNWMSLTGRYGKACQKQAIYLLQQKCISFIGSDLHHDNDLPTMAQLFNTDYYRLLESQPLLNDSLLNDEPELTSAGQAPLLLRNEESAHIRDQHE